MFFGLAVLNGAVQLFGVSAVNLMRSPEASSSEQQVSGVAYNVLHGTTARDDAPSVSAASAPLQVVQTTTSSSISSEGISSALETGAESGAPNKLSQQQRAWYMLIRATDGLPV